MYAHIHERSHISCSLTGPAQKTLHVHWHRGDKFNWANTINITWLIVTLLRMNCQVKFDYTDDSTGDVSPTLAWRLSNICNELCGVSVTSVKRRYKSVWCQQHTRKTSTWHINTTSNDILTSNIHNDLFGAGVTSAKRPCDVNTTNDKLQYDVNVEKHAIPPVPTGS